MRLTPNQQDALDIEKHVCVTAGAGSGKTTVLVKRYLKILSEGNVKSPREIVAITFTEKAAAEMKDRIVEELSAQETREGIEQSDSFQGFREEMGAAHISTIHAFCSRILREFPFQAGVPANFSIVQSIDQKLLLQQSIKDTLKQIATDTADRHRAELTRLLQRYGGQQRLVDFFSTMVNQRDVLAQLISEIYSNPDDTQIREGWEQQVREELTSAIDMVDFIRCLKVALHVAKGKNAETVKGLTGRLEALPEQSPNVPEVLNLLKEIRDLITTKSGTIAKNDFLGRGTKTAGIETEIDLLITTGKKIQAVPPIKIAHPAEIDENGNKGTQDVTDDDFLIATTRDLFILYERILSEYQNTKFSQGKLDFSDLQIKTRDLLRNNAEIREALVSRHKYYMIDEYQDTNELQYELVMLLTNELKCAKLFIVGDPKQSIYAFRGANVSIFEKTRKKIRENGGCAISLTENFRSLSNIIAFVNYFFYGLMGAESANKFEVPYESLTKARPTQPDGSIEFLFGTKDEKSADESAMIARYIKNMKLKEEKVWARKNGKDGERSIAYGDIAILIRSRTHLPNIEHALLEASIPYLTTGGIGFYQRQEIYDIWNYLNFLNKPTENHASLVGVLRGPAFGISDTELYEISAQEETDFWEKSQKYPTPTEHLRNAIDTLKRHIQIAHRMSVNQLILTIVNETGMIGALKTGKQGPQRWANYQKLLEFARNFDADEDKQTLTDFIEFLNILIDEEPREGQAPMESSADAVEIMTIHAAKGKQFPVVILPCLERKGRTDTEPFIDDTLGIGFSPLNPKKDYEKTAPAIVDRMKDQADTKGIAEKKRVLYVGTTRAEDRLILSGSLPANGKPQQALKWLHEYLHIDNEADRLSLPVALEVFANNHTTRRNCELQIPISRTLADLVPGDETSDDTSQVDFPDPLPATLQPATVNAAFSVSDLANYARCPLRYQLENLLQIPPINGNMDPEEQERDSTIRQLLAQIRQQSDAENLDTLIEEVSENDPEITSESKTALRRHANNFLNSEIGEIVFNANRAYTNQQIHANINGHIIEGRLDRLFKDKIGQYQLIIYDTTEANSSDLYRPEMELYALLVHRRYPEQPTITINLFFSEQGQGEQIHFSTAQLRKAQEHWEKRISKLQSGIYEKNLEHCCSCPYADRNGQCIIIEAQGEEK